MVQQTEATSLFECFKSVCQFTWFGGNPPVVVSETPGTVACRPVEDDPRILQAADVFFDRRVHSALETLQQQQQDLWKDEDETLPTLEASLSSDESSSSSSSNSDEDAHELVEVSSVPRHGRKRPRTETIIRTEEDALEERRRMALDRLKSCGNHHRLALTLTGSKGVNQDCGMVVHPLLTNRKEPTLLLGVLDGHASMGHQVAEHCRKNWEEILTADLQHAMDDPDADIAARLARSVETVDQGIPQTMSRYGGTTLSAVVQLGPTVYLVNTGDSMSMVCAYIAKLDQCVVLETTDRHVPEVPQECERIVRAGGVIGPQGYVLYQVDEEDFGLGMSRSLGDRGAPGVIATPQVTKWSVSDLKERVIQRFPVDSFGQELMLDDVDLLGVSVSDGVLDVAYADELASCLTRAFFGSDHDGEDEEEVYEGDEPDPMTERTAPPLHPMVAVEHMIQSCAQRWQDEYNGEYRDDITIAAAKLL